MLLLSVSTFAPMLLFYDKVLCDVILLRIWRHCLRHTQCELPTHCWWKYDCWTCLLLPSPFCITILIPYFCCMTKFHYDIHWQFYIDVIAYVTHSASSGLAVDKMVIELVLSAFTFWITLPLQCFCYKNNDKDSCDVIVYVFPFSITLYASVEWQNFIPVASLILLRIWRHRLRHWQRELRQGCVRPAAGGHARSDLARVWCVGQGAPQDLPPLHPTHPLHQLPGRRRHAVLHPVHEDAAGGWGRPQLWWGGWGEWVWHCLGEWWEWVCTA